MAFNWRAKMAFDSETHTNSEIKSVESRSINREFISKLADHIENLPKEQFSMEYWGVMKNFEVKRPFWAIFSSRKSEYRPVACIAGWACILDGVQLKRTEGFSKKDGEPIIPISHAQRLMGISPLQASCMFFANYSKEGAVAALRQLAQ